MTDLPHLAARLYGTPLMIARPKLAVILEALGPRLAGGSLPMPSGATGRPAPQVIEPGIAVVPVLGTLVRRSSYLAAASGLMAYADIGDEVEAVLSSADVRGVLLELDTPGGEAGGVFDLADRLSELQRASGKPIWAIADEAALSAGYAIASVAEQIWLTRTAEVGSIGVVAVHVDQSAADRQAGLAYSFVHAGAHKIDGSPHLPLSDSARARIQADVDALNDAFVDLVARNRGLAADAVRRTEAATFRGERAVVAGLADWVGNMDTTLAAFAERIGRPRSIATRAFPGVKENAMKTGLPEQLSPAAEPAAVIEPATPVVSTATTAADPGLAAQLRAEMAELMSIAAQAARLGVTVDAAEAMRRGIDPAALRRSVLDTLASRDVGLDIVAAAPVVGPASAGERPAPSADSPLLRAARAAAASSREG
ncbi:Periplasmic serine protease [alpha proteobacterium BAL199]|nr:Periplasmic serine protease [alpha proteobacterium BAL199]